VESFHVRTVLYFLDCFKGEAVGAGGKGIWPFS
jgi:hypothetical protein